VLDKKFGAPRSRTTAVTIAREIEVEDGSRTRAHQLVREVATSTNDVAATARRRDGARPGDPSAKV